MTKYKRRIALCGALCGTAYLLSLLFAVPESVKCFTIGVACGLLLLSLLSEETLEKLEKMKPWTRHGD